MCINVFYLLYILEAVLLHVEGVVYILQVIKCVHICSLLITDVYRINFEKLFYFFFSNQFFTNR